MLPVPSEFTIAEIYLPPMLVAAALGAMAAVITSRWMNRRRLGRYLVYPSLVFVSMTAIYTVVIGTVFIGI